MKSSAVKHTEPFSYVTPHPAVCPAVVVCPAGDDSLSMCVDEWGVQASKEAAHAL